MRANWQDFVNHFLHCTSACCISKNPLATHEFNGSKLLWIMMQQDSLIMAWMHRRLANDAAERQSHQWTTPWLILGKLSSSHDEALQGAKFQIGSKIKGTLFQGGELKINLWEAQHAVHSVLKLQCTNKSGITEGYSGHIFSLTALLEQAWVESIPKYYKEPGYANLRS